MENKEYEYKPMKIFIIPNEEGERNIFLVSDEIPKSGDLYVCNIKTNNKPYLNYSGSFTEQRDIIYKNCYPVIATSDEFYFRNDNRVSIINDHIRAVILDICDGGIEICEIAVCHKDGVICTDEENNIDIGEIKENFSIHEMFKLMEDFVMKTHHIPFNDSTRQDAISDWNFENLNFKFKFIQWNG